MKPVFLMVSLCFILFKAGGQDVSTDNASHFSSQVHELKAGDRIPEMVLHPMGASPFRFSSLKGKLVILDFFGKNCSGCVKSLPGMQKLQERFGDKLKILVVTKDDSSQIKSLLSRFERLKSIALPIITNDSLLSRYFYYATLPTHVWIDTNGRVIQKTGHYNTTAENIQNWLAGKKVKLPGKNEFADFQHGVPLFSEGGGRQVPNLKYYSIIMGKPEGGGSIGNLIDDRDSATGKVIRILRSPTTLHKLYAWAFQAGDRNKNFLFNRRRVIFQVDDPEKLDFPQDSKKMDEWRKKYFYSYEIKVPAEKSDSIYAWMRQDLERYFGYKATIEKRKVKCWVLKAVGEIKSSSSQERSKWDETNTHTRVVNMPFYLFVANIEEIKPLKKAPLVNEISGVGKIDLDLRCNINDISGLKKELLKNKIALVEEEREMDMFVISKN